MFAPAGAWNTYRNIPCPMPWGHSQPYISSKCWNLTPTHLQGKLHPSHWNICQHADALSWWSHGANLSGKLGKGQYQWELSHDRAHGRCQGWAWTQHPNRVRKTSLMTRCVCFRNSVYSTMSCNTRPHAQQDSGHINIIEFIHDQ